MEIDAKSALKALHIENVKLENELLAIKVGAATREVERELAGGEVNGEFQFVGQVHEGSVHNLMIRLENYVKRHPAGDIRLLLNSGGGSVVDGLALVDYLRLLRKRGHRVTITGVGLVASMASAILMAADERVMTSRCWLGLHEVSSMVSGSLTIQEDHIKFSKALQKQLTELLTERSTLTARQLEARWARKDIYINAQDALKFGLIDRIEEV